MCNSLRMLKCLGPLISLRDNTARVLHNRVYIGRMMSEDKKLKAQQKKLDKIEKKKAKQEKFEQKKAALEKNPNIESKSKVAATLKAPSALYTENTPVGDRKNTFIPLPNSYSSKFTEAAWYSWWESQGFFKPEYNKTSDQLSQLSDNGNKFVVIMPPPNVTGTLHLGHALMCAIEDVLVRWARMKGKIVLWNPGCDHAGIATQVVVERKLKTEQNMSRFDLGREKFLEQVWLWKNEKGCTIYNQMKRLGISCDWSRACFTMDEKLNKAVVEAFIRLHDEKLIYRSNRLVNWSCSLNSVISDIEVDKKELTGKTYLSIPGYDKPIEFGTMTYFYYPLDGSVDKILIATTRLETMLGDVAIVVNPNDPRFTHLHGKLAIHPFCDRKLPIITDESIDIEFGTGIMKVTPAHDFNDYELGIKHSLPSISILSENGYITDITDMKPEFKKTLCGIRRFDARTIIADILKTMGLFDSVKSHSMVLPMCSRSKDIIEPLLKPQWYIDCKEMAKDAVEMVKNKHLRIIPSSFEKAWYQWMENHRDWCISRQLWWGHRIPAYKFTLSSNNPLPKHLLILEDNDSWVSAENEQQARLKIIHKHNIPSDVSIYLEQDEDVLDTWFSSGLFPFSVFGWPEKTEDFEHYYPTTLLETGHDILFFWVARMVMLGRKLTNQLPFSEILLHSLIRDAHGRKMSKSLGNIIDPIDVIEGITLDELNQKLKLYNLVPREMENAIKSQKIDFPSGIPECGADALRFSLCAYTSQGRDINLDILRVQGYRFFCNKVWNAVKFVLMQFDQVSEKIKYEVLVEKMKSTSDFIEKWILSRLDLAIETADNAFSEYQLQKATTAVYNFWLYEFCDVFIECAKPTVSSSFSAKYVLLYCVQNGLRLLSPFMPFITEELYQRLPIIHSDAHSISITIASFPTALNVRNVQLEENVTFVLSVVRAIRSTKDTYVPAKTKTDCFISFDNDDARYKSTKSVLNDFSSEIIALSNLKSLRLFNTRDNDSPINGTLCAENMVGTQCKVHVVIDGLVDPQKELDKLKGQQKKISALLTKTEKAIQNFDQTVSLDVRSSTEQKFNDLTTQLKELESTIAKFESITL